MYVIDDSALICVYKDKVETLLNIFNSIHRRLQFLMEMKIDKIKFLDMTMIKRDDSLIITN